MASSSPTSRTGNASFTAPAWGPLLSPGGTGSAVLAATGADIRVLPAREGASPGPVSPLAPPSHLIWGREAASVSGRRDLTLAPSQAAGGDGHRPGGSSGDDRRIVYTKCLWSDFDSSGRLRGGGFPPTAGFSSRDERVAPAAGLPPARDAAPRPALLGILGSVCRQPSRPRSSGRVGACAGSWDARALTDDLAAGLAADWVYDSVDELAWAMQTQLATLAGSPAIPVWSRPDPTFKPRLSGFLATPQGPRRVTVLLDTGATHCFICARLAATLGLPPSAHPGPTSVTTAAPGGTQDLPAPVMAHLGLGDTFREALSVSPMDMDVDDDLILGWDWISSHDLRLLYVDGRVSLRSGPAQLQMDLLPAGARLAPRTLSVIGHGEFHRLLRKIERVGPERLSRPPPLRPRRRRHVARRAGPARSTPITPTLLPSKARNGRRLVLGGGLASRRSLTVPPASSMAWRCSRTAQSSTWHPFAWPTRNCASREPTILRLRRSR